MPALLPAQAVPPPPVSLPVDNILQETPVWCWAAVAQQIISATVGPERTPPQCGLVAIAYGAPPQACCAGYNPQCVTVGSMQQIQFLINRFGGRVSAMAPPTDPGTLYRTLASGRPIILHVQTSMTSTHVVILKGMFFVPTPTGVQPMLEINDPMSYFTGPVPYQALLGVWREALVVN